MMNRPQDSPRPASTSASSEAKSIFALMVLVVALANLPAMWGLIIDHEGLVFTGFYNPYTFRDGLSYIAKMRAGWEGHWLYTNPYTTEPHQPALIFTFYLFLGHVARLTHLPPTLVFHLARIGSGLFLLFGVKRLVMSLSMSPASRVFAFSFIVLASGFGWIMRLFGSEALPVEFSQAEAYTFQSMMHSPHLALSSALLVWTMTDAYRYLNGNSTHGIVMRIFLSLFTLAWVHPRLVMIPPLVFGVGMLWTDKDRREAVRDYLSAFAGPLIVAAVPMLMIYLSVQADPMWSQWSSTRTPTDSPLVYFRAYGLLWPLALLGVYRAVKTKTPWAGFLSAWVLVATLLPYLPIIAQRRLAQGWNIPLALLSGFALGDYLLPRLRRFRQVGKTGSKLCATVICLLLVASTLMVVGQGAGHVYRGHFPGYASRDRIEAMRWIRENLDDSDTVLSSTMSGLFVPPWSGARVVVGHWAETLDLNSKEREIERFFDRETTEFKRREILSRFGASHLFYGQWERLLGDYDPQSDSGLWRPVWQGVDTTIYQLSD